MTLHRLEMNLVKGLWDISQQNYQAASTWHTSHVTWKLGVDCSRAPGRLINARTKCMSRNEGCWLKVFSPFIWFRVNLYETYVEFNWYSEILNFFLPEFQQLQAVEWLVTAVWKEVGYLFGVQIYTSQVSLKDGCSDAMWLHLLLLKMHAEVNFNVKFIVQSVYKRPELCQSNVTYPT